MEKRYAASAIIYNSEGLVLLARRAPTKNPFPGAWSLPSTYLRDRKGNLINAPISDDEMKSRLVEAVKRKLSVDIYLMDRIGFMEGQQGDHYLTMTDFIGKIVGGKLRPNQEDFSEADFFDPIEKCPNPKGFCTRVLLKKLQEDPLFWRKYY